MRKIILQNSENDFCCQLELKSFHLTDPTLKLKTVAVPSLISFTYLDFYFDFLLLIIYFYFLSSI